jgi:cyclophilin family peptidyl-prolyl cis-trans isomerase
MDINIGETPAGRIKMELFSDIVPKCVLRHRSTARALTFDQVSREL